MDNLSKLKEKLKKIILETGDEWALDSYVKLKSIRNHQYLYFDYLKIFGLCRALMNYQILHCVQSAMMQKMEKLKAVYLLFSGQNFQKNLTN